MGWCVRDNMRRFIIVGVAWDFGILSIIEVKVMALKQAIQSAIEMNMNCVTFESDS